MIRKTIYTVGILVLAQSIASAQWGGPSKGEVQEYIETFVSVGLYAVPNSEPISVLLASPDIAKMALHSWVNGKRQEAEAAYDDAYFRRASAEELLPLSNRANRYQAVYSCLFQNDCGRLRKLEAMDMQLAASGEPPLDLFADSTTWNGAWAVKSYHDSGPAEGGSYPSTLTVRATGDDCHFVTWNNDGEKWRCSISGTKLTFSGTHPSGGKMDWVFVRDGHSIVRADSTFNGSIITFGNAKSAHGTYDGHKK